MVRPSTSILQTKLEALQTVDFDTARIALTKGFVSLICSSLFLYYIYIRRKKRESKRERKEYSNFINYSWVKFEKAINEIYVSCICLSMYLTLIYCLITLGTYERPFPITFKGSLSHTFSLSPWRLKQHQGTRNFCCQFPLKRVFSAESTTATTLPNNCFTAESSRCQKENKQLYRGWGCRHTTVD